MTERRMICCECHQPADKVLRAGLYYDYGTCNEHEALNRLALRKLWMLPVTIAPKGN